MDGLRALAGELVGLFVDDGKLAIASVLWLAAVWFVLPYLGAESPWSGALLFVGLAAILVERTCRYARRSSR